VRSRDRPPASGRHKGTIGEVATYICAILSERLWSLENAWGKNAFRSLHSFGRQPTFSDLVHRKLVTPMDPTLSATSKQADKQIIRIKSDRKWPEPIVFDTSAPTIVPQNSPVIADAPVTNPPRSLCPLNAPVQEVSVTPLPVKAKRKIAKRAPSSRWTAYRPAAREALPAAVVRVRVANCAQLFTRVISAAPPLRNNLLWQLVEQRDRVSGRQSSITDLMGLSERIFHPKPSPS
jgi:hypothetical protein